MAHTLPKLPYSFDALEPHIDAKTMEIHHGKHHAGYVEKLNQALAGQADWERKSLEELLTSLNRLPEKIRTAVRNNGGGHFNHSLFWPVMKKAGGGEPKGELAQAIKASFAALADFKSTFTQAALGQFGSGWAWLVVQNDKLAVLSTPNQDNPLMTDAGQPILGLDVWEHAYYLKYQNRRADYVEAWWNVVNWEQVAANFAEAKKLAGMKK